jgi:Uma2 family endonuclease
MLKTQAREKQKLMLYDVSWEEYTQLLRGFGNRHLRLTYDRGTLEIMTLTHEHESDSTILGRFVVTLTEELNMPIKEGRSTTFRKRKTQKGLEPDNCYWIVHEAQVRGKKVINLRIDPPPDLSIEVDITHSSMNRMRIYASLGVPEVWRWDRKGLSFLVLNSDGKYDTVTTSPTFPIPICPADLIPFIAMRTQMDENAVIREFRNWVRAKLAAKP